MRAKRRQQAEQLGDESPAARELRYRERRPDSPQQTRLAEERSQLREAFPREGDCRDNRRRPLLRDVSAGEDDPGSAGAGSTSRPSNSRNPSIRVIEPR